MTLCGACAGRRPATDRFRHDVCDGCGTVTECGVFDDLTVPISPRAVPPASGLRRRWGRAA